MRAVEIVRHELAFAVRVDDHFTMAPVRRELAVSLDSQEPPVRNIDDTGYRHDDGTYRWLAPLAAGAHQVTVAGEAVFTWTATTPVVLPLADPKLPVVIEVWPAPNASVPPGTLAIRGQLVPKPPAAPVPAGQEVRLEAVGTFAPRNRKTRGDADGEFLFLVLGAMEQAANLPPPDKRQKVRLSASAPGRTVAEIDVYEGASVTTFAGSQFAVLPGRETRVRIKLS